MAEQKKKTQTKQQNTDKKTSSDIIPKKKKPTKAEMEQLRMEEEIRKAEEAMKNQGKDGK